MSAIIVRRLVKHRRFRQLAKSGGQRGQLLSYLTDGQRGKIFVHCILLILWQDAKQSADRQDRPALPKIKGVS